MGRNFDLKTTLENFRRRLYRSRRGKMLGVFSGIAESLGYPVKRTRIIGVVILVIIAGLVGANGIWVTVMVGGFFYMLLALLMQPPRPLTYHQPMADDTDDGAMPPPIPPQRWGNVASPVYPGMQAKPRVDLAEIDRQLDSLNRRIQRMETIVTDRQYDWERRLDS